MNKMNKEINEFDDLRFNISNEMHNMFVEILTIKQILKENKLSKKDKKLFEKELKELTTLFVMEFRKNNTEQIKTYNELVNK